MFTGIIEEIGIIREIKRGTNDFMITIEAKKILKDVQLGDSIAVNGVCLTVTTFTAKQFTVDVMPETIKATSLNTIAKGSKVNLERAMAAGGRFGGHFVSGHVDGIGVIKEKRPVSNAIYFSIEASPQLLQYIISKGSICVDGISLTVVDVTESHFSISIIPHTLNETILNDKQIGDIVNLECDMLVKYMEKLLERRLTQPESKGKSLTMETLAEHGYL